MDDLLREFLTETNESLAVMDLELVKLEQNPEDPKLLGSIFRIVHTIKGTCGFLGLPRLERVAHAGENVLGKIRDGEMVVSEGAISLVLESLDRIKSLLAALEEKEVEPDGDDSDLIGRLNQLAEGAVAAPAVKPAAAPAPPPAANPAQPIDAAEEADRLDRAVRRRDRENRARLGKGPAAGSRRAGSRARAHGRRGGARR